MRSNVQTGWMILVVTALLLPGVLSAQYEIPWHTMDGGGGTSTGGIYVVSGTIGQPDTIAMQGGAYELQGGFWAFLGVLQTEGGPALHIRYLSPSSAILSWPVAGADGFQLRYAPTINDGASWTPEPNSPVEESGEWRVTVTNVPSNVMRFYQLKKP